MNHALSGVARLMRLEPAQRCAKHGDMAAAYGYFLASREYDRGSLPRFVCASHSIAR